MEESQVSEYNYFSMSWLSSVQVSLWCLISSDNNVRPTPSINKQTTTTTTVQQYQIVYQILFNTSHDDIQNISRVRFSLFFYLIHNQDKLYPVNLQRRTNILYACRQQCTLYTIYLETSREIIKSNQDHIAPTCGGPGVNYRRVMIDGASKGYKNTNY